MQERHQDKEKYFGEQAYTTRKHVVPLLEQHLSLGPACDVLEIGCGEGGNLVPFLERSCRVTGVDLSEARIALAREFFSNFAGDQPELFASDIYNAGNLPDRKYDLVIMRDVIEHIHDQDKFMGYVKRFLKDGGYLFLAFPPWYNPFGGHQQICRNRLLSHLPYFHLLPRYFYNLALRAGGEDRKKRAELMEIKETGISIERFRRLIRRHDYQIIMEQFYLVNPNYEIKFGMKPRVQCALISGLPWFRNFLTTAVYYLLRHNETGPLRKNH